MSADLSIFIKSNELPSKEEWERAIESFGFSLKFSDEFNPVDLQGFLPCKFEGEDSGFEYFCDQIEDTVFDVDSSPEIAGKDLCIGFSSSFEQKDLSSAVIAAATLAKITGGVVWIMEGFDTESDPIEMAKQIVEHGLG